MTKFSTPLCSMNVMRSRFSNTGHCQLFFARVARFSRVFLGSRNYKFSIRLSLCSTIYCLHNKSVPCFTQCFCSVSCLQKIAQIWKFSQVTSFLTWKAKLYIPSTGKPANLRPLPDFDRLSRPVPSHGKILSLSHYPFVPGQGRNFLSQKVVLSRPVGNASL